MEFRRRSVGRKRSRWERGGGLLAGCAAGWVLGGPPAHAGPALTGPLINGVTTDMQSYTAGQVAHVTVTLLNNNVTSFTGTISGIMSGRGRATGVPISRAVTSLPVGVSRTIDLTFPVPTGVNFQGYLVSITAANVSGTLDMAAAALDVSSDWSTYPRECFVTKFTAGTDTQGLVGGLNAWHCNVLQFYDNNYKHHLPYSANQTWPDLANTPISRSVVQSYISAAHMKRMAVFDYTLWNGAYPNFAADGTGVSLSWGMFTTNCAPNCRLVNMAGTPSNGGLGDLFPSTWAALWLAEMDPTNPNWISYFAAMNAPLISNLSYDGLQIDTLGNPGTVYDSNGRVINLSTALSGFQNAVRSALHTRGVINNVSDWDLVDVARNAQQDFYYSELHPEFGDAPYYPSINGLTTKIRKYTSKGINLPVYMDSNFASTSTCITGGGSQPCYFNLPGLLYIDSTMFAAGAYHVYLADGDRFVSNIYVPGAQLLMSSAAVQAEYDYQTFAVAMEKLLRNNVLDSYQPASILFGAVGSNAGAAGTVYLLPKIRPGLQILHLLNYSKVPTIAIQDSNATQPAPKQLGAIGVKMYYSGSINRNNMLWFASPDVNHGTPQSLPYTKGYDGIGTYITFTAPSLLYWDMFWLELDGLGTSDYALP
jgi:dextranase